jgi:coenzyme F420-reducing hydrogenase beta subunit
MTMTRLPPSRIAISSDMHVKLCLIFYSISQWSRSSTAFQANGGVGGGISFSPGTSLLSTIGKSSSAAPSLLPLYASSSTTKPQPIDPAFWPDKFPAKSHCSKCGLCETLYVTHVVDSCAFLGEGMRRNIDGLESTVHGRTRHSEDMVWDKSSSPTATTADEARFGVLHRTMMLARGKRVPNAQWTGCVTGIAISMLEAGQVDAVVCIASNENNEEQDNGNDRSGWSNPEPILARTVPEVLRGRGVKPALAPSLRVLDELKASPDIKKLLFCGVGCAVQAFRAIQHELGLEEVYVLGTNCADNSPTSEDAREFLRRSVPDVVMEGKNTIFGYEFMQDFRVHVKYDDGNGTTASPSYERKPYFCKLLSMSHCRWEGLKISFHH